MNTLTIDQNIYNGAEIYAKRHNVSVRQLVEEYLVSIQMLDKQIFGEYESADDEHVDEVLLTKCFEYAHKDYLEGKCKPHTQVISEIKQKRGWK